uniref:Major facilitator superfamily (MFS) profile domain-containing protein n=1 Tax=Aureoumbra lagunensis TaxID=44058 RepID=A0A7S3NKT8_9STRA
MSDESDPLLPILSPRAIADSARTNVLLFMLIFQFGLGGFAALRESYTEKILNVSDPVATATWALVAFYAAHAITMPLLGKLSDYVGRKILMLMGLAIQVIAFVSLALNSRSLIFIVSFGVLGALDSSYTMMQLALVDTSNEPLGSGPIYGFLAKYTMYVEPENKRAHDQDKPSIDNKLLHDKNTHVVEERRVGALFSLAWMIGLLGSIFGVIGASAAATKLGIRITIIILAGCYVLLFLRILYAMPETAPDNSEAVHASGIIGIVTAVLAEQALGIQLLFDTTRRRMLLLASFLEHAAASGAISLISYWLVFKFGFGIYMQSAVFLATLILVALSVLGLQGFAIELSQSSEQACAIIIIFSLPLFGLLAFSVKYWMALIGIPATAAIAILPELRALLTADLPKADQGFVQGALTSLNAVADIVGSLACLVVFEETVDDDIPHDSHRSRGSLQANSIWHAILFIQLIVAFILFYLPTAEDIVVPVTYAYSADREAVPVKGVVHPIHSSTPGDASSSFVEKRGGRERRWWSPSS